MDIILGSRSPRRKELLQQCNISFRIDEALVDETITNYKNPKDYVIQLAKRKGNEVFLRHKDDLVICADTIVCVDQDILGKPKNKSEAYQMIKKLSGRTHDVYTGVYVRYQNMQKWFVSRTQVTIDQLTEEEIEQYINLEEPYDKAGAYGIQGFFGMYVKSINGDYYNVMGLPIHRLMKVIKEIQRNEKTLKVFL
jgi:septum formation protein